MILIYFYIKKAKILVRNRKNKYLSFKNSGLDLDLWFQLNFGLGLGSSQITCRFKYKLKKN